MTDTPDEERLEELDDEIKQARRQAIEDNNLEDPEDPDRGPLGSPNAP
jgi:hypothetical protein